ncbi:hypothetical protein [Ornithinibacillus halophilus]|uniref:Uncharacterized protein n=1 Tax=Ornithinibacillus halophilus TaxID=930117 RepID=A0A1M5LTV0_9BACI|nr:hypothetical protein [Ornithinibacillus halophilus]SHG68330.1 hypothetical protein SAMN05216225_105016 [Ornithinibacillus halophilus]
MRQSFDKFILGEIVAIALAVVVGLFGLIQASTLLIILSIYLISISILCDAMVARFTYNQTHALKQFARAITIFIVGTFLLIFL